MALAIHFDGLSANPRSALRGPLSRFRLQHRNTWGSQSLSPKRVQQCNTPLGGQHLYFWKYHDIFRQRVAQNELGRMPPGDLQG